MKALLSLFLLIASGVAQADIVDVSLLKAQFEQRTSERVRAALDPLLGSAEYSILVQTDFKVQEIDLKPVDTFFPKLGISASTAPPVTTHLINFDKWVKGLQVEVLRSDKTAGVQDDAIKKQVQSALKHFDSAQLQVQVSVFAKIETLAIEKKSWPWTAAAIVLAALLLSWAAWSSARFKSAAASALGFRPDAGERPVREEAAKSVDISELPTGQNGMRKWAEWLAVDAAGAHEWVGRLASSVEPADKDLLGYVFQFSDVAAVKSLLEKAPKAALNTIRECASQDMNQSAIAIFDRRLSQTVSRLMVERSMEGGNAYRLVQDFTAAECAEAATNEPALTSLFARAYPASQMAKILPLIPTEQFEACLAELNANGDAGELAKRAHKFVFARRQNQEQSVGQTFGKWIGLASRLNGEREKSFFNIAAQSMPAESFVAMTVENFPQFLAFDLPETVLKSALSSLPVSDRVAFLFGLPPEERARLLNLYSKEANVFEMLQVELEMLEERRAQDPDFNVNESIAAEFYKRLRDTLRGNAKNKAFASNAARNFFDQGRGVSRDSAAA